MPTGQGQTGGHRSLPRGSQLSAPVTVSRQDRALSFAGPSDFSKEVIKQNLMPIFWFLKIINQLKQCADQIYLELYGFKLFFDDILKCSVYNLTYCLPSRPLLQFVSPHPHQYSPSVLSNMSYHHTYTLFPFIFEILSRWKNKTSQCLSCCFVSLNPKISMLWDNFICIRPRSSPKADKIW